MTLGSWFHTYKYSGFISKSEIFSLKWRLPFLPSSSFKLWIKEKELKAALILMKRSQLSKLMYEKTLKSCHENYIQCLDILWTNNGPRWYWPFFRWYFPIPLWFVLAWSFGKSLCLSNFALLSLIREIVVQCTPFVFLCPFIFKPEASNVFQKYVLGDFPSVVCIVMWVQDNYKSLIHIICTNFMLIPQLFVKLG